MPTVWYRLVWGGAMYDLLRSQTLRHPEMNAPVPVQEYMEVLKCILGPICVCFSFMCRPLHVWYQTVLESTNRINKFLLRDAEHVMIKWQTVSQQTHIILTSKKCHGFFYTEERFKKYLLLRIDINIITFCWLGSNIMWRLFFHSEIGMHPYSSFRNQNGARPRYANSLSNMSVWCVLGGTGHVTYVWIAETVSSSVLLYICWIKTWNATKLMSRLSVTQ